MPREQIAIVGTGLVGASWALVLARANHAVRLYDLSPDIAERALIDCRHDLERMADRQLLDEPVDEILARMTVTPSLEAAVDGACYVQESVREDLVIKTEISRRIDACMASDAIVGSSTSGFPSSKFTSELAHRSRFLVVHPVNPPHLVPVVEIVPAPWTDSHVVESVKELMYAAGQQPVLITREIDGFILNRLQGALLDEAWRLYTAGYASLSDIDATVSHGLGRRWCFVGPFETIDLNSVDGISGYAHHLAPMYERIANSRPDVEPWAKDAVFRADSERRSALPLEDMRQRQKWRDEKLLDFLQLIRSNQ